MSIQQTNVVVSGPPQRLPSAANSSLHLYSIVAHLLPRLSFKARIMAVAFAGTHIPLLALITYSAIFSSLTWTQAAGMLILALIATLAGTAVTLYMLFHLLQPVTLTDQTLQQYVGQQQLPNLPTHYRDEVGRLMANTQFALTQLDEAIAHSQNYDRITALPNRFLFGERLQQSIQEARSNGSTLAVLVMRVNHLDIIRLTDGPEAECYCIATLARGLRNATPAEFLCARLSDNEFGVLIKSVQDVQQIDALAQALLAQLTQAKATLQAANLVGQIGIALYPTNGLLADELLQHAATAIALLGEDEHKSEGKREERANGYAFFAPEDNVRLQRRLRLSRDLHQALQRGELSLHYQPQMDLHQGRVIGAEALMRWHHPQLGMVPPNEFIPLMEDNGMILVMSQWLLSQACTQANAWSRMLGRPMRVAINVSARQLCQPNFAQTVAQALMLHNTAAECLEIEITESGAMHNLPFAIQVLSQLRTLGVSVALDDFGTGYSSLTHLQKLPVQMVKIDREFVRTLDASASNERLVAGIFGLARQLGLKVLAEGVETQAQLAFFQNAGFDCVQGFLLGKPVPATQFEALIRQSEDMWTQRVTHKTRSETSSYA